MPIDRRAFLAGAGAAMAQTFASAQRPQVELGAIQGSVSQMKWTPAEFLDYLSKIDLRHAMISLPRDVMLDESAVKQVRAYADKLGISLILAHGSVCPSSRSFNASLGTVEEQVAPALRASQIFGARSMRCVLGSATERPGIDMHLENMLRLSRAGAVIVPPAPGFYTRPQSVADMVDFVVARILDQLHVPNELTPRWGRTALGGETEC